MAAGPLMVDIAGLELSAQERELLLHPSVSGVILFARNFESVPQLEALVTQLRGLKTPRLLIAVDQEGGRVQRFGGEFSTLPALRQLGACYARDPEEALSAAWHCGWLMASEMLAVGIDISFAPVLDIDRGISEVIGSRAFASDIDVLTALAREYIAGMHTAGMAATGKHFPGHGSVKADSHVALPVDERPWPVIYAQDMAPFRALMPDALDAVMVSHVIYPDKDKLPAGFSRVWVSQVLRQELGFQGVIFSDDITMQAAASVGSHQQRAQLALEAGCDCVIACNDDAGRAQLIEHYVADAQADGRRERRFAALYAGEVQDLRSLRQDSRWKTAQEKINKL